MIPLSRPTVDEKEIRAVEEVLRSGWLAHGPKVKEFESLFAGYIGTAHAIAVNSCTSALQLAIQAHGITGEIIMPSFTFVASANAAVTAGATPVFVDIEPDTCTIDPGKVEEKITGRTQAIMPVHFAGQPCDMGPLMAIAGQHGLAVIEDSAECIGGAYRGRKTGSFGTGCFSFYPTKNITTGEGGMITTNDDGLAQQMKTLKAHGISSSAHEREQAAQPWFRAATAAGYNFRMSDINAAIGIEQMKKLDQMNRKRQDNAARLSRKLRHDRLRLPAARPESTHVYQMYTITLDPSVDRTAFIKRLHENGIQASVHFSPPVHLQPYYQQRGWKKGDFPVTEQVAETIVSLPFFPAMTEKEIDFMAQHIRTALDTL